MALCCENIRKDSQYKRDNVTDALIQVCPLFQKLFLQYMLCTAYNEIQWLADKCNKPYAYKSFLCESQPSSDAPGPSATALLHNLQQSILEFKERKKLVQDLKSSAQSSCDIAVRQIQALAGNRY